MTETKNTIIDLKVTADLFVGANQRGKIVIGDKGFEFINNHKNRNLVYLPWDEISHVVAARGIRKGKIMRFSVQSKRNIGYVFTTKDPKGVFRAMRKHMDAKQLVYEKDMFDRLRHSFRKLLKK
ncbi:hypothetical protein BSQ38_04745 [Pediococcus damnosus]|uniref:DUF956 family protein n=1 Tax=Pediococcus damnosus TaxID=51663 RepID=UPI000C1C93A3|nr:DUF956 family protein [Pediococcus damnosus]PIO81003.1 hypothetical protein BSQ38_04745 [Pediococcus damnosus]